MEKNISPDEIFGPEEIYEKLLVLQQENISLQIDLYFEKERLKRLESSKKGEGKLYTGFKKIFS